MFGEPADAFYIKPVAKNNKLLPRINAVAFVEPDGLLTKGDGIPGVLAQDF